MFDTGIVQQMKLVPFAETFADGGHKKHTRLEEESCYYDLVKSVKDNKK